MDFEKQKQIIMLLKEWIEDLEKRELVKGFAFNHYFNLPNEPDALRLRFDFPNEEKRETVKKELEEKVKHLFPNCMFKELEWTSPNEGELEAYEFGSRCAFLFWDLVKKERLKAGYISDFEITKTDPPWVFQQCFNHGVMNSLGISKVPNELKIHIAQLVEATKSKTITELVDGLKKIFGTTF